MRDRNNNTSTGAETMNWNTRKSRDGRLAKTSRVVLQGVGKMAGGRARAEVQVAVAEQTAGGITAIVLRCNPARDGRVKPLVWKGEAACLDTAEFVVDEQLPIFAAEIATWCRQYLGYDEMQQTFTGYESHAE